MLLFLQKSEQEADMILNTQTVTQEPFYSELIDGGRHEKPILNPCFS